MYQRVNSHTSGNKPNLSWSWKPAGSGLVHCWMVELFQPKDGNCFLWNLFLGLELIILFLVYEWFARICVCAAHAYLVPLEFRNGHRIPWRNERLSSCHVGAGNQIWVLFKSNEYSVLLNHPSSSLRLLSNSYLLCQIYRVPTSTVLRDGPSVKSLQNTGNKRDELPLLQRLCIGLPGQLCKKFTSRPSISVFFGGGRGAPWGC